MNITIHKVYWTHNGIERGMSFTDLNLVLKKCEELRKAAIRGEPITFITSASEYGPEVTVKQGVDVVDATYDWKKRRTM